MRQKQEKLPTNPLTIVADINQEEIVCFHCGSDNYVKGGRKRGKQNYICKDCKKQFIPKQYRTNREAELVAHLQTLEISCYHCGSKNYRKEGHKKDGRQRYFCKNCKRRFTEGCEKYVNKNYLPLSEDVWNPADLGVEVPPCLHRNSFVFLRLKQEGFKALVKRYIRYISKENEFSTLNNKISCFNVFSEYLNEQYPGKDIDSLSREIIVNYLSHLNERNISRDSRKNKLSALKQLLETAHINKWVTLPFPLILDSDYPHTNKKHVPRYMPEEVIKQLNEHLDWLPEPVMRMTLIIQECGLRVSELCRLSFNCLKQDSQGSWFLLFMRWKMKEEGTIPISLELAAVIQEQQQYIRDHLGENFDYLFCRRDNNPALAGDFVPVPKVMATASYCRLLKKLFAEFNICDSSGKPWKFQSHQFRHTVGTKMINNGVPYHIIQRYLGHSSPEMTMRYARIHDETLKNEIAKYHDSRVVNIAGEVVSSENPELDNDQNLQWMKRNILAQALPNGSCARPLVKGECPHPNACLTCGDFRTTKAFLGIHQEELERTEKILEKAKAHGWQRQVEMNEKVKQNLNNIITTLEVEDE